MFTGDLRAGGRLSAMPRRSNRSQKIVYLIKKHLAPPGSTVTESKMLKSAATGRSREVDIVVETTVADEDVVISVEVFDESRRADASKVEQLIKKHEHLPTSQLVIVSWSGFTDGALDLIASEGGHVTPVTPKFIRQAAEPQLWMEVFQSTPERANVYVDIDGQLTRIEDAALNVLVYDTEHEIQGELRELLKFLMEAKSAEDVSKEVHSHAEDLSELRFFEFAIADLDTIVPFYVRWVSDDGEQIEFRVIRHIEAAGSFKAERHPIAFDLLQLGKTRFGSATLTLLGTPTVWVGTDHPDKGHATVSWRPIGTPEPTLASEIVPPIV